MFAVRVLAYTFPRAARHIANAENARLLYKPTRTNAAAMIRMLMVRSMTMVGLIQPV